MNDLPATWQRWAPHFVALIVAILGLLCVGVQNDPEWYKPLGISSGTAAMIVLALNQAWQHVIATKSAKAMPPAPVNQDGRELTRCEQGLHMAISHATANGDKDLVAYLNAAPIKRAVEPERA